MNEVYLYFRTQGTIADDDDKAQSCLFPMSSFAGYEATSASGVNSVVLYFKSMLNHDGKDQADATNTISDSVIINLKSTATQKEFISAFTQKVNDIASKKNKFFMVGDDLSTDTQYFTTLISDVSTITIAAAHS
tara:strand:- start:254 stop:655 length:402 start_codon:yes stop_codon:yes gene_type:complete